MFLLMVVNHMLQKLTIRPTDRTSHWYEVGHHEPSMIADRTEWFEIQPG